MAIKAVLFTGACLAAVVATPTFAQEARSGGTDAEAPVPDQATDPIGDPVASAKVSIERDRRDGRAAERDIIVTGTRIVRPNSKSAAPITTTTADEIAAQGATTIEEALNRLPQVQPDSQQNDGNSDGRQRIQLRSLGFERTLTLVDGLRLGIQNGQDVSIIPTALVERVDVLSGGASSVYGSDAVSGVVNFILKKNFDGVTLTGNYSMFNHDNRADAVSDAAGRAYFPAPLGMTNDGRRVDLTVAAGKTLFGGAMNITGFFDYRSSAQVSLGDRSYSACEVTQTPATGALDCTRSTYTQAGTIIPGTFGAGPVLVNDPTGSRNFVPFNSGPGTAANPYDNVPYQRSFNRINAGGFLTADVSSSIELYGTALYYRDRSYNTVPNRNYSALLYGEPSYQVNCDNPFLSASQRTTLCGTQTSGLVPVDVRYRFDGLSPTKYRFDTRGIRIAGGVRGKVLDDTWSYDVAGVYARNAGDSIYPVSPKFDRVNRSLDVVSVNGTPTCVSVIDGTDTACVPFNAFAPSNASSALGNYLFTATDGSTGDRSRMWQGLATLSGDLGKYGIRSPFAEQGVAVAFGAEFRAESYTLTANEQFRQSYGGTDVHYSQNVWEVNGEVQAPLIEKRRFTDLLQVNGGYRVSSYNRLRGSFDTWKVEGLWAPVADITFRGSINKAQRAPGVIEAALASNVSFGAQGTPNDPCASTPDPNSSNPNARIAATATLQQCRRTGLPDNLYNTAAINCPDQSCTVRSGGFGLTPETAYTKTFGVVLRPRFLKGLTFSADRFIIDLNNTITLFYATDFLNGCLNTGLDYYCRGVVRNPNTYTLYSATGGNPSTGFIAQGTSNGYKSQSDGWDFQGQYALGLGGRGTVALSFNGSLTTRVGKQDSPDAPARNCVGYYGAGCGASLPRWKHILRTTWTSADRIVNISVNWRHIGPMTIVNNADPSSGIPTDPAQRLTFFTGVKPYDYFDLSASFDIGKRLTLRLSANNLFDRDPPLVPDSRNLVGQLNSNTVFGYDLLGRQLAAGVVMRL